MMSCCGSSYVTYAGLSYTLREFRPGLGVSAVTDGLIGVWRDSLDGEREPVPDRTAIEAFRRKFASRQWMFRDDDPAGAGEMAAGEWPE